MGTNYYAIPKASEAKQEVMKDFLSEGRYDELKEAMPPREIHIGKSSGGWQFLFNHNNWVYWDSLESLKAFLESHELYDEYQRKVTAEEIWELVEAKKDGLHGEEYERRWDEFHPGQSRPYYMKTGEPTDEEWFGLRFSTSAEFS